MSAEKKHDYHLVDPSPWPIYTSFSCLVLAIGTIFYMHNDVSWGMYLGLALKSQVRLFTLVSNLTLTTLSNTIFGASLDTWVVPPNPVTRQNMS